MTRIISLLTDFGSKDPYVGEIKATLLQNCPAAVLVDITHQVERHNVVEGAYLLEMAVPYFPAGTVHLGVIDPGVGSDRLPVVVECRDGSVLVGPNNGLLFPASRLLGVKRVYRIESPSFMRKKISHTFHGRDMFAIAAARIARGTSPAEAGGRVKNLVRPYLPKVSVSSSRIRCSVIHIDAFGNVITNARSRELKKAGFRMERMLRLKWKNGTNSALYTKSYYRVQRGEFLVLEGSQGYVEVACREESAAERMKVKSLDELFVSG